MHKNNDFVLCTYPNFSYDGFSFQIHILITLLIYARIKEENKMNNTYPFPMNQIPGYNQLQQIQNMFPQPQGSVYAINSPLDIGNVPTGSTGLSVAICFAENLMYIKSFQNGQPVIMAYRVSPFQKEEKKAEEESAPTDITTRLSSLEQKLNTLISGGKFDGLL